VQGMEKDAVLLPVTMVDSLDSHNGTVPPTTSIWKKFIGGNDRMSAENETKRAMQSRHLMMIGE
jgi:amino acid permease